METVTLPFQTPYDLSSFRKRAADNIVEVPIKDLTLICNCKMPYIVQAMNYFGAKVLNINSNKKG